MILSGNGGDFTVPGKNVKVNVKAPYERKDMSGGGSSTSFAAAGNKAKSISVSLILPFEDIDQLSEIVERAEAMDKDGNPVVYTVVDDICQAFNIREAIFDGEVSGTKSEGLQAYDVSFAMKEYNSVAEKREERAEKQESSSDPAASNEKVVGSTDPEKVNEAAKL